MKHEKVVRIESFDLNSQKNHKITIHIMDGVMENIQVVQLAILH
jgi:hypothetical protein